MTVEQSSGPVVVFMTWRGEPRWRKKATGHQSSPMSFSTVFKVCRHPAPVWTKPAGQNIPCMFDWTDRNTMLNVRQVYRRTANGSPKNMHTRQAKTLTPPGWLWPVMLTCQGRVPVTLLTLIRKRWKVTANGRVEPNLLAEDLYSDQLQRHNLFTTRKSNTISPFHLFESPAHY